MVPFWREVSRSFSYAGTTPSLRDFVVTLFRGAIHWTVKSHCTRISRVFLQTLEG